MNGVTDVGGVPMVHTGGDYGGGWMGMLLVLALLGGGRGFGGFGGWGGGGYGCGGGFGGFPETRIEQRMDYNFIREGQFGLQKDTLLQGERLQAAIKDCCCTTNRNIDSVKFENCQNTSAIIQNATANTQRIIDKMCADELRVAYAKIAEQGQHLSEARIIASIKPVAPIPAYLQPNPYESFRPHGGHCPAGFAA